MVMKGDVLDYNHPHKGLEKVLVTGIRNGGVSFDLARMDESLHIEPSYVNVATFDGPPDRCPPNHVSLEPTIADEALVENARKAQMLAEKDLKEAKRCLGLFEAYCNDMEKKLGDQAPEFPDALVNRQITW